MSFSADMFNVEKMNEAIGHNPLEDKDNKFKTDERFYKLAKDKNGNGSALIRFLPYNPSEEFIVKMYKINTTIIKNGKKRFIDKWSPTTIGKPCPFQEEWQRLWNLGDKEGAKTFSRGTKWVTNIKIIKDPANPENENKIFLYEMSNSMKDKISSAMFPSEQDRALGKKPKQMFNPLAGHNFLLTCKKDTAKNMITYADSEIEADITSIYETPEQAMADIQENAYNLKEEMLSEKNFSTYEELIEDFNYVTFSESNKSTSVTEVVTQETQETQHTQGTQTGLENVQTSQVSQVSQVSQPIETTQPTQGNQTGLENVQSCQTPQVSQASPTNEDVPDLDALMKELM